MGGCIQKCCLSESGTICCTIISVLGLIYFLLTWAIFERNFAFFEFHIPTKSDTRMSCLVAALIYLIALIWALYRLNKMNRQKAQAMNRKNKKSVGEEKNIPSVFSQEERANQSAQKLMMREEK